MTSERNSAADVILHIGDEANQIDLLESLLAHCNGVLSGGDACKYVNANFVRCGRKRGALLNVE